MVMDLELILGSLLLIQKREEKQSKIFNSSRKTSKTKVIQMPVTKKKEKKDKGFDK
jgi:hypothetical protein